MKIKDCLYKHIGISIKENSDDKFISHIGYLSDIKRLHTSPDGATVATFLFYIMESKDAQNRAEGYVNMDLEENIQEKIASILTGTSNEVNPNNIKIHIKNTSEELLEWIGNNLR